MIATLTSAACTGTVAEPEEVETCDGLVAVGVDLVERYVKELADIPPAFVMRDEPLPAELEELVRRGDELDARVAALGCDTEELRAAIGSEVADLEGDSLVAELMLGIVVPSTSTTTTVPEEVETEEPTQGTG